MSETGMDHGAIFVGTCLAAAFACFAMGVFANWPVALAPGMGLNAYFTYVVVGEMGYSWQTALAAVFIAGIVFHHQCYTASSVDARKYPEQPENRSGGWCRSVHWFHRIADGWDCRS